MSKIKLKTCPFCGGIACIDEHYNGAIFVHCNQCKVDLELPKEYWSIEGAEYMWNRRAVERKDNERIHSA